MEILEKSLRRDVYSVAGLGSGELACISTKSQAAENACPIHSTTRHDEREEVAPVRSNINKTWEPTLPCAAVPAFTQAHPASVGFLAVQGALTGGPRIVRPRINDLNVGTQQSIGAYRTSGSAAAGSLMADVSAPAGAKASGVPPRGRPV